jgi:hypothetical protein
VLAVAKAFIGDGDGNGNSTSIIFCLFFTTFAFLFTFFLGSYNIAEAGIDVDWKTKRLKE